MTRFFIPRLLSTNCSLWIQFQVGTARLSVRSRIRSAVIKCESLPRFCVWSCLIFPELTFPETTASHSHFLQWTAQLSEEAVCWHAYRGSLRQSFKHLPVWPTYALPQSRWMFYTTPTSHSTNVFSCRVLQAFWLHPPQRLLYGTSL